MSGRCTIFCVACQADVKAELVTGEVVYPHIKNIHSLLDKPFWRCPTCRNFVGCHHKTKDPTKPLGVIATKELKNARQHIHRVLDPLWQDRKVSRREVYRRIARGLGIKEYHTAELRSVEDARRAYKIVKEIANEYRIPA